MDLISGSEHWKTKHGKIDKILVRVISETSTSISDANASKYVWNEDDGQSRPFVVRLPPPNALLPRKRRKIVAVLSRLEECDSSGS